MLFKYQNQNNEEQSIELPITIDKFIEVRSEVGGSSLGDLNYYWTFWKIRDVLFKRLMFEIHNNELSAFLKRLQDNQFNFEDDHQNVEVKAVDIYYNVYYWDSVFIAGEPNTSIYDDRGRLELHLEFDIDEFEHLLVQLLDAFDVKGVEEFQDEEYLATSELGADSLFEDVVKACWLYTKQETTSEVIGLIFQATGCGSMSDLDTGDTVEETDEGIKAYLKHRGIAI